MNGPRRHLILVRHAKTEPNQGSGDQRRKLTAAGTKQAIRLGRKLDHLPPPDCALVSPATRAEQTWDLFAQGAGWQLAPDQVRSCPEIYGGFVTEILELVAGLPDQMERVVLVGHEPTISSLGAFLADPNVNPALVDQVNRGVSTGTSIGLSFTCLWSELGQSGADLDRLVHVEAER